MENLRNKKKLAGVYVYKIAPDESKPGLVGTFFTHYRARRVVLELLARQPKARDWKWDIRASVPA